MSKRILVFCPALLIAFGCGGGEIGGVAPRAEVGARDAGARDGGQEDAGAGARDGGREGTDAARDAGARDGGLEDAAARDASARDADAARDAETPPPCPAKLPLPITPCAVGYGVETPAGSGRHTSPPQTQIIEVSSLAAGGPGTLRACVETAGPRTCVFSISGVIELTSDLSIREGLLTIAGQAAPFPGISIHGAGIRVRANDVLIQHLRVRVGDRFPGPMVNDRDALGILNSSDPPERVVIDHCSFAFSSDEAISVWYDAGDISILNSIIGYPLHDSIHVDEGVTDDTTDKHGYGPLFGEWEGRVAMIGNLLAHHFRRNPRSLIRELVFVNNVVYDYGALGTQILSTRQDTISTIVGNDYLRGPETRVRRPIKVSNRLGSSVFIDANRSEGVVPPDPLSLVELDAPSRVSATPQTSLLADALPASEAALAARRHAGAWASARDSIDAAIVSNYETGGGGMINCVEPDGTDRCDANAGGWPRPVSRTQVLAIPMRPHEDDDQDGYTNLEEWLHARAALASGP